MSKGKVPTAFTPQEMQASAPNCAILIISAGFEDRARRVLELLKATLPLRIILVKYPEGIKENDANYARMKALLHKSPVLIDVREVVLDPRHPDDYLHNLKSPLVDWRPDAVGEIWIDISALPMQGICSTLAATRESNPALPVRVLYTEAAEYYPSLSEINNAGISAMSLEMSDNLIPKHFGGSSGAGATCLIVFAGYEKHRSVGVIDELNPSKLVLIYGRPERKKLQWRLDWSKKLHKLIKDERPTASEVVPTFDPMISFRKLSEYYEFLFSDHTITVAPICSKMQCVACYLFWERYRDVQLVFPLPISYLPKRFSDGARTTFQFELPEVSEIFKFGSSLLNDE